MSDAPQFPKGAGAMLLVVGALGIVYAASHPTVKGAGTTAKIDGRDYVLKGAYETKARAEAAAAKLRKIYRERKYRRVSIRIIRRRFRGTAQMWLLYARARFDG